LKRRRGIRGTTRRRIAGKRFEFKVKIVGMRTLLSACVVLTLVGSLAAQSEVPGDQCLGGSLVSIQQDSITLKFNEKIMTMHLAPDAEIWRRGVDLDSIHQLEIGDHIYLKCSRAAGAVVASVVAAVEKDDGIDLAPHHIAEIRVCIGRLVAIGQDTLSAKNENGICVIHFKPGAEIWRGEVFHDTSALKLGDEVDARVTVAYPSGELTAEEVEANVAKAEGTIVSVRSDRILVKDDRVRGHVTVLFDSRTALDLDEGKLKKGATVLAVGLDLGHDTFRATSIVVEK
jgi:hypothetical protein